jgi:hypothetical protein
MLPPPGPVVTVFVQPFSNSARPGRTVQGDVATVGRSTSDAIDPQGSLGTLGEGDGAGVSARATVPRVAAAPTARRKVPVKAF